MSFAIIRLGKDSVADIRALDALHQSPAKPIQLTIQCTQVPQALTAGDYAFLCFGSDNDKGIRTEWERGVRALGTVQNKSGGPGYNDSWTVNVEVKVVLPGSVAKKDLLSKAHAAYYWFSDIPVIGIEAFSNQTIQLVKETEPNQNVAALVYGLGSIYPSFRTDTLREYPALAALFAYIPSDPSVTTKQSEEVPAVSPDDQLKSLTIKFSADAALAGIRVETNLIHRYVAALLSKQFLIATGLAGSGKTKLAQAFARWITSDPGRKDLGDHSQSKHSNPAYVVVPVGADWTGNDNILGYPDGLDPTRYVTRPALDLIQRAAQPENADLPHFLILDEMNLSHVERYFADLLSLIESGEVTELYRPVTGENGYPQLRSGAEPQLRLSPNLFIIGTVNVDETTYMFSPKVLDRANVIEFRMDRGELAAFLTAPRAPDLDTLNSQGGGFGAAFVAESAKSGLTVPDVVSSRFRSEMLLFFDLLRDHNAEFGFRVVNEAARFMHFYRLLGGYAKDGTDWFDSAMDAVIVQKLLPKLHGSRPRLEGLLWALAYACGGSRSSLDDAAFLARCQEAGKAQEETKFGPEALKKSLGGAPARYPLSFDKVLRMWDKLVRDQFVTFAEA